MATKLEKPLRREVQTPRVSAPRSMPLSKSKDLHGAAPDDSPVALLLTDWINDLEFESGDKLLPQALRQRAKQAGVPVIYCNDNFGRWRSDFRALLKPKHSAFHSTTLEVLLEHLGATTLILTGIAGNFCVLFSAPDAYMRDFQLLVPSDCVASEEDRDNRHALEHMAKTCKADAGPSSGIDFARLRKAA